MLIMINSALTIFILAKTKLFILFGYLLRDHSCSILNLTPLTKQKYDIL